MGTGTESQLVVSERSTLTLAGATDLLAFGKESRNTDRSLVDMIITYYTLNITYIALRISLLKLSCISIT